MQTKRIKDTTRTEDECGPDCNIMSRGGDIFSSSSFLAYSLLVEIAFFKLLAVLALVKHLPVVKDSH